MIVRAPGKGHWEKIDPRTIVSLGIGPSKPRPDQAPGSTGEASSRRKSRIALRAVKGWLGDHYVPDTGHEVGWVEDFKDFCADTSAHGIKYIFFGRHKVVKVLFLVVWLMAIAYAIYVITSSTIAFVGKPTGTKFQIIVENSPDRENIRAVQFPTVSVCSHNRVSSRYLQGKKGLKAILDKLNTWDEKVTSRINWRRKLARGWMNVTYESVIREGGPPDWTFLQCTLSDIWSCEDVLGPEYFTREASISGNCFRINPYGKLNGKGGDYGKMLLMFFADLNDYSENAKTRPEYGYTLVIHDHESYSSTTPSGFYMSPGSIYKVDLSTIREFRKPPPAGNCDETLVENTYGRYEENSCIAECRDDYIMSRCGCVLIVPPVPERGFFRDYRPCTLREWAQCGIHHYRHWVTMYADVRETQRMCNCPPPCKLTVFKAQLSSSAINKFYARNKQNRLPTGYTTEADVMENLLVIEVLFSNTQVSEIREIVTYGWGNFLGDVGGVLGLFLGASAFTIIEFAQFIMFVFCKYCISFRSKQGQGKEDCQA